MVCIGLWAEFEWDESLKQVISVANRAKTFVEGIQSQAQVCLNIACTCRFLFTWGNLVALVVGISACVASCIMIMVKNYVRVS